MSDELDGASFNKNYKILRETADWLSGQKEPDIDRLVPRVETAMKAYQICKDRLDKVQATLGQYFDLAGEDGGEPGRRPRIAPTADETEVN
ncbi:exodeoxyribonuclease VII small subunit [Tundrisphaera sp. TA3]|uniref:exodeoxyribonuclease VII small subunit n=1 Tax=Tundrisphaera sp. TA3 TaxID=3435775 RepID=UPI003EBF1805